MNSWTVALITAQLAFYGGLAGGLGGAINFYLLPRSSYFFNWLVYLRCSLLLALVAAAIAFLLRVEAIAESGLAGMFDETFLPILLYSNVGYSSATRLAGLAILLLATLTMSMEPTKQRSNIGFRGTGLADFGLADLGLMGIGLTVIGAIAIAASFAVSGHVAELHWSGKLAVFVHIMAVMFWLGALYPLLRACYALDSAKLLALLESFSRMAVVLVAVLLLAGAWLVYLLLPSLRDLFESTYGLSLLGKIFVVAVMLALAACNKFYWSARIRAGENYLGLRRSIQIEIALGLGVLAITAVLANALGPTH